MKDLNKFLEAVRNEFADDRLTYQKTIPTFHPESAEEASDFIKLANSFNQELYITGFGNNIDPIGSPFDKMVSIRTDRLNDIIEIVPEDFYITVGSGYPLREINLHLKEHKLWLPHSSLSYVGSVGGALAAGLTAKYDVHDLPLKKYFIRAEIVTPQGEIITPGSTCFKSVSGYDIVKIFFGSWGLLGLIVSATFRVMPESGADDYGSITLRSFDRSKLLDCLDEKNNDSDAVYSRKVKEKFDPKNVLPIV